MSFKESISDNLFALVCIILYPAGSIWWLMEHRLKNNRRFLVLCMYGCITALTAINTGLNGCLINKNPESWTMFLISAVSYGIGLIAFIIMSWHKSKKIG
ncbi:MAG: hypothetical protein V1668_01485 [Patescibacteria group bacterium]